MREIRSSGSVEGVMSNHDPYSDQERKQRIHPGLESCMGHREVSGEA